MIAVRSNHALPYHPILSNYVAECEHIRAWLVNNAQGMTGEVRPVFHMQNGTVRKVEVESRQAIYKKND